MTTTRTDPLRGLRLHDQGLEDDVSCLLRIIEQVDAHLDDAGPQRAKDCPEANRWRRVGRAQLEAAEAMEELSLLTGENPRKGLHPEARGRMLAELGDTACSALFAIQSQTKNTTETWAIFLAALAKAESRVPATGEQARYTHPGQARYETRADNCEHKPEGREIALMNRLANAAHISVPDKNDARVMAGVLCHYIAGSKELRERLARWMGPHEGDLEEQAVEWYLGECHALLDPDCAEPLDWAPHPGRTR
jgi:hypothetical protein